MISIDTNILEAATGQLENYDFDSMVVFDGKLILAGADGLMERDNSGSDNGTEIDAWYKTGSSNFGTIRQKRLKKAYASYEAYGDGLTVGVYIDETLAYTESLSPTNGVQESARINGRRSGKGSVMAFLVSNVNGSDFSVNEIEITPTILASKPQGS